MELNSEETCVAFVFDGVVFSFICFWSKEVVLHGGQFDGIDIDTIYRYACANCGAPPLLTDLAYVTR